MFSCSYNVKNHEHVILPSSWAWMVVDDKDLIKPFRLSEGWPFERSVCHTLLVSSGRGRTIVGEDRNDIPSKDSLFIFGNHPIILQLMVENPGRIDVSSLFDEIESYHSYMDG